MQSASQRDSIALPRASDSAASPAFGVALRTRPVRPPCTTTPCGCRLAGATRAKHQIEQLQAFVETEGRLFPLGLEPFASYFFQTVSLPSKSWHGRHGPKPVTCCVPGTAEGAIRRAFERAIRVLRVLSAHAMRGKEKGQASWRSP